MKIQLTKQETAKYPNIEKLHEVYKIKERLWFASGEKNSYSTSAMGYTREQALETLELHLSYVI
jgi:hypothetical protein